MNTKIIGVAVFIAAVGSIRAWSTGQSMTRVIVGSFVFLLMLSILTEFGQGAGDLASSLAMLALVVVILDGFPFAVIGQLLGISSSPPKSTATAGGGLQP